MDTTPIPANTLESYYHVDGEQLERHYKEHLSGYRQWEQQDHADQWLLFPENMGTQLSIDETPRSEDLQSEAMLLSGFGIPILLLLFFENG